MRRSRAYCLIRQQPQYRHEAFERGLARAGYQVLHGHPNAAVAPGDVLLIWNRYGDIEGIADRFEAQGGTCIVAENGYIAPGGGTPKHDVRAGVTGKTMFALALDRHNGGGRWFIGGPERWAGLGIELQPWRTKGEHILVCPNRSFGTRGNIMPLDWAEQVTQELRKLTDRPIRVRPHPGNHHAGVPLEKDFKDCWAVVIWSSSVGVHALVAGIPVICKAGWWVCEDAVWPRYDAGWLDKVSGGFLASMNRRRRMALWSMAWAQWSLEEIESGEPFALLADYAKCTHTPAATSTA